MHAKGRQRHEPGRPLKLERETSLELATSTFGKVALYQLSYSRAEEDVDY